MRLRTAAAATADPFSTVLGSARVLAARAEGTFGESALLRQMEADGVSVVSDGADPAGVGSGEAPGLFVAKLALDYLYARRELTRRLGGDGSYVYGRSG